MLFKYLLATLLLVCSRYFDPILGQESQSVPLPKNGDTCNVVNLHCGPGPGQHQQDPVQTQPGPPGKLGPVGRDGPRGAKGEMGDQGSKGEKGRDANITKTQTQMAQMLAVSNCRDLEARHGITTPGYYSMKSPESLNAIQVYCDFRIHEGVSTCHELQQRINTTKTGIYSFKPTGSQNSHDVFCNFETGNAVTEIWHDEMMAIRNSRTYSCSSDKGCYSWSPSYKVPAPQILDIVTKSSFCRQFLGATCHNAVLKLNGDGGYAWWVSRDGAKMTYWGGTTTADSCACGDSGTCSNKALKCNCDSNRNVIDTDEGYLADKSKLPVRELRFGDLSDAIEQVWHTLGKLECWNY